MTGPGVSEAIAAARTWAATAGTRHTGPADPDAGAREALRALAAVCPGSGWAEATLAVGDRPPVAIDPNTMTATSDALSTYAAALAHFAARIGDGCAVELGPGPAGTLVAVRGTAADWSRWLSAHAVEVRTVDDGEGSVREDRVSLEIGRGFEAHWSPPLMPMRAGAVTIGTLAQTAEGERMRSDRGGAGNVGFAAWLFGSPPDETGRRLQVANRKLGEGVDLLATGLLPLAGRRADGWSLSSTGVPVAAITPPEWLISAWRGRWTKAAA